MGIQTTQGGDKDNWMDVKPIAHNTSTYTLNIPINYMYRLLHSSTYDIDSEIYATYEHKIENSNYDDTLDLYNLLIMNQRDPFFENAGISNSAIDSRLDRIMLIEKY